jgi:hypothetical protein
VDWHWGQRRGGRRVVDFPGVNIALSGLVGRMGEN